MTKIPGPVKKYLADVKKNVPVWLEDDKEELNKILDELKEHIFDRAAEIAGGNEPSEEDFIEAINKMEPPVKVAEGYKRRGTPKVWISEELWPIYEKVLGIVLLIIGIVNLAFFAIGIIGTPDDFFNLLFKHLGGFFMSGFQAFAIISIIFAALSMEGFLPENLKIDWGEEEKATKKMENPLKPEENIFGGILAVLFSFYLIAQPSMTSVSWQISPGLSVFLQRIGFLLLINGALAFSAGMYKDIKYHQFVKGVSLITTVVSMWLVFTLSGNLSAFTWYESIDLGTAEKIVVGVKALGVLLIASLLFDSVELIRLPEKYKKFMDKE